MARNGVCNSAVIRYTQSGLEAYAKVGAFVVAVLINLYRTILNVIAALGWFRDAAINRTEGE